MSGQDFAPYEFVYFYFNNGTQNLYEVKDFTDASGTVKTFPGSRHRPCPIRPPTPSRAWGRAAR